MSSVMLKNGCTDTVMKRSPGGRAGIGTRTTGSCRRSRTRKIPASSSLISTRTVEVGLSTGEGSRRNWTKLASGSMPLMGAGTVTSRRGLDPCSSTERS